MREPDAGTDSPEPFAVHLLDVGTEEYGDAVLCQFGGVSVLVDGAHRNDWRPGTAEHPSIPEQLSALLEQAQTPYRVSLLIVSHAHQDHIGCLPDMVQRGLLRADWALVADPALGWGRLSEDDSARPDLIRRDRRVEQLVAALREEVRTRGTGDDALLDFLADAADLEERYTDMLERLRADDTRVVRHGVDDPAALLEAFKGVGLRILGPSPGLLRLAAERIARDTQDAIALAERLVIGEDAPTDRVSAYRRLVAAGSDAADAASRFGAAVNLQSIIARFRYKGKKLLFTGDMQLARPDVAGAGPHLEALRQTIVGDGPYDFLKIGHHGSDNAFDAEVFEWFHDTRLFGICAGEESTSHPSREALDVLKAHAGTVHWARTDHNGRSTFNFAGTKPKIILTTGEINDPTPNQQDRPATRREPEAETRVAPVSASRSLAVAPGSGERPIERLARAPVGETSATPELVEVVARVPHVSTRVTVQIDVAPAAARSEPAGESTRPSTGHPAIANGRDLPELLFVTSREGLSDNIGEAEAARLLRALRDRDLSLCDDLPRGIRDAEQAMARVRPHLDRGRRTAGVVLVGGYDIVPSQRLDTLDRELRRQLIAQRSGHRDADDFVVWSDDVYGDRDGDGLPELPVSRIPDAKTPALVEAAIGAGDRPTRGARCGVRNVHRPFADQIYRGLPGEAEILVSEPTAHDQSPPYHLDGDQVYLMLHGSHEDGSRFWGEDGEGMLEAFNIRNLRPRPGAVILTGACWGALTVDRPAARLTPGGVPEQRTPGLSIALSSLLAGARAFVGCTGSHYSPAEEGGYFGGPLHAAFWGRYNAGVAPARALFEAKIEYLAGIPHGQTDAEARAIENKILRQFTCLGLGW